MIYTPPKSILLLILLAFFSQILIPAGYMPSFNKDGSIEIVICSIEGDKTVSVDTESSNSNHHSETSLGLCPYAVLTDSVTFGAAPNFSASKNSYALVFSEAEPLFLNEKPSLTYMSRGPPHLIL